MLNTLITESQLVKIDENNNCIRVNNALMVNRQLMFFFCHRNLSISIDFGISQEWLI